MTDLTRATLEYLNGELSEMAAICGRMRDKRRRAALVRRIERLQEYKQATLEGVNA